MQSAAEHFSILPSFQQYVEDRKYIRNVSPKTLSWYQDAWKAFGPHLEPILASGGPVREGVRAGVVALSQKGVRPVSVNSYLTCVRAYLWWLFNEGHLKEKPKVQLLKCETKIIATFSQSQIQALLNFKPKGTNLTRAHTVALVLLDTGLRISEALGLELTSADFDNLNLTVRGKGNKQRLVPISFEGRKVLYKFIQRRRTPGPYIFGTRNGTKVTVRNFLRDFKALGKRLGLMGVRVSPHTLRHTFAVSYLRSGGNIYYLSKILGHTSVRTTERYLQSLGIQDLQAVHNRLSLLGR
jgi:integrase/recombinase XerD